MCRRNFSIKFLKINGIVLSNIYFELIWILPWSRLIAKRHVHFRSVLRLPLESSLVRMTRDPWDPLFTQCTPVSMVLLSCSQLRTELLYYQYNVFLGPGFPVWKHLSKCAPSLSLKVHIFQLNGFLKEKWSND